MPSHSRQGSTGVLHHIAAAVSIYLIYFKVLSDQINETAQRKSLNMSVRNRRQNIFTRDEAGKNSIAAELVANADDSIIYVLTTKILPIYNV